MPKRILSALEKRLNGDCKLRASFYEAFPDILGEREFLEILWQAVSQAATPETLAAEGFKAVLKARKLIGQYAAVMDKASNMYPPSGINLRAAKAFPEMAYRLAEMDRIFPAFTEMKIALRVSGFAPMNPVLLHAVIRPSLAGHKALTANHARELFQCAYKACHGREIGFRRIGSRIT